MAFTLPPLPYAFDALEPSIDARTMEIHHGKHHATYVTNLNKALESHADLAALPIVRIVPWAPSATALPNLPAVRPATTPAAPLNPGTFRCRIMSRVGQSWGAAGCRP